MLTVLHALNKSTDYLEQKGIESPRMNAELLLADILKCKRLELYLMYDRPLTEKELTEYREYLKRRSTFEPAQYIIGTVEFYGLEFNVSPVVLIPRPETEILVETVIDSVNKEDELRIMDIGSGSGNISIAIAVNLPNAYVIGIEISESAITVAEENLKKYDLNKRVSFLNYDILGGNRDELSDFDIIVSNPPYVSKKDYGKVQKEILNYEPNIAVTDFHDGYKFYREIISLSAQVLKPNGKIFLEIAQGQSKKISGFMKENNFKEISIVQDYQKIERVIYGVIK
jgi:release factor glutamine methyltransferase